MLCLSRALPFQTGFKFRSGGGDGTHLVKSTDHFHSFCCHAVAVPRLLRKEGTRANGLCFIDSGSDIKCFRVGMMHFPC